MAVSSLLSPGHLEDLPQRHPQSVAHRACPHRSDASVQAQEGMHYSNVTVDSDEKNDHIKQRSGTA